LPGYAVEVLDTTRPPGPRSRARAFLAHLGQIAALYRRLRSFRPHLVHLHTCSRWTFFRTTLDILTTRLFGTPVVLHLHGGFFDRFLDRLSPWGRAWAAFHLRRCVCVVVLSAGWRHRLLQRVPGLTTAILPNAVPASPCPASALRRQNRLLFVGDLAESKGIDDLLRAMACLPDDLRGTLHLRVAGEDPERRWVALQERARRLGIAERVDWLGPLPPERLAAEYANADVFVLPSHGEGMPLSLLEAMAAGLACVVTDVGAVPEVVTDDREARVVPTHDPPALARAIAEPFRDEGLRRRLGQAARARAADFDLTRFYSRLRAIWADAVRTEPCLAAPSPVKNSA
jgi:glycosyltransferase involved in cell wall biosynthesis